MGKTYIANTGLKKIFNLIKNRINVPIDVSGKIVTLQYNKITAISEIFTAPATGRYLIIGKSEVNKSISGLYQLKLCRPDGTGNFCTVRNISMQGGGGATIASIRQLTKGEQIILGIYSTYNGTDLTSYNCGMNVVRLK